MRWRRAPTALDLRIGANGVRKVGVRRYDLRDPYRAAVTLGWRAFALVVLGYYLAVNALFGGLYLLQTGSVMNLAHPRDAFFFSVETFAAVGYGVMAPATLYGHLVATTEIIVGMASTAVITGLLFVRLSRPKPAIAFSSHMVIAPLDGVPTLMIRLAHRGSSLLFDAAVRLTLVRATVSREGVRHVAGHELSLVRNRSQIVALAWTLMHRIDEVSPLGALDEAAWRDPEAFFMVSLSGQDEHLTTPINVLQTYRMADVLQGHRFGDMIQTGADGRPEMHLSRLNDVEAVLAE